MLHSWKDFGHAKVPVVKARIEDIVRRVTGPKVLEVGCNEGFLSKAIAEDRGFEVISVDNNPTAIIQSKENFGINVLKMDANFLDFPDNSFDTVLGCELLEHVENPGRVLAEMIRVSKGHVIISLPIGAYWLGEPTHLWELSGSVIEHEPGPSQTTVQEKHAYVIEFFKRRKLQDDKIIEVKR